MKKCFTRICLSVLLVLFAFPLLFSVCAAAQATPEEGSVEEFRLGSATLLSIVDSPTTFEAGLLTTEEYREKYAGTTFPGVVKTWLLITDTRKILFDTGWGTRNGHHATTISVLGRRGIAPEDITDILATHLDIDHVSGLVAQDGSAAFPKAVVHVSEPEYTAWMQGTTNRSEAVCAATRAALALYTVKTFAFDEEVLPGIHGRDASGHTPGHTVYDIDVEGSRIAILGDIMHIADVQLRHPSVSTSYDMLQEKAAQSRVATFRRLEKEGMRAGGMHFPMTGYFREHRDGAFTIEDAPQQP